MTIYTDLITWRAVLDVLLISLWLFFIYTTLRRLGTWKILAGILLAIGIYAVAIYLDLDGIIWIYSNVSQVAVIGFIVLFQPEIRKLFERAVSPRRKDTGQAGNTTVTVIGECAETLAKQRRSALIVIPGKDSLDGFLAGGNSLNADLSVALLLSIFDPHSPGHDGAVVILNDKVHRFGARLPISGSDRLPKEFGTRHFAAAGLSEQTDALVIAVSEERGTITTFQGGTYKKQQSAQQLTNTIKSHWQSSQTFLKRPAVGLRRKFVFEVIASFLVAIALWYSIVIGGAEIQEKIVNIPVEYVGTPKDLTLTGDKLSEIQVHLKGPQSNLANTSQLRARVDLARFQAGRQKVTLTADNINLAKKMKLIDVQPSTLTFELVSFQEKELIIKPQLVGKLPDAYRIASIEINPTRVKTMVRSDGLKEEDLVLMTTPIYLENMTSNTTIFGKVVVPPRIQPVDRKWPDVEIQIKLQKKQTGKSKK